MLSTGRKADEAKRTHLPFLADREVFVQKVSVVAFALSDGLERILPLQLDDELGGHVELRFGRRRVASCGETAGDGNELGGESFGFFERRGVLTVGLSVRRVSQM